MSPGSHLPRAARRVPSPAGRWMLRWVVAPDAGGQHPHPDWPGHPQPFSCITQLHPHPAQPTDPSRLQELILITSFSLEQLSFLVPSPSSLLGTLAFSIRCGSAADMGSIHTPIPAYKPSIPPSHLLSPLLHPSYGAPHFAGHTRCQRRGPTSPRPLPATSPGAGGFCRHDGERGGPSSWSASRWLPAQRSTKINRLLSLPETDLYREQKV